MASLKRIAWMSTQAALRTYVAAESLVWIIGMPIVLSLVLSLWMGGASGSPWADAGLSDAGIAYETPRGDAAALEYPAMSRVFGVYLIFVFSALITRSGAIHEEARRGTLQRALAMGVPHWEIVAAHGTGLVLVGLVQAVAFFGVTGLLGTPWLASGWSAVALPVAGAILAAAGVAVGIAGFVRSGPLLQMIGGGGPSMLAMMGGAFFPLDVAPAGVQRLAFLNPVHWAVEALSGGFVYKGLESQAAPLAVLLLFAVAGAVIGVQGLRRDEA